MDINLLYNEFKQSQGISTDTRNISKDQLFFALRGPNFNANKLAEEALQKGARFAVIDDPEYSHLPQTFLVKDSLSALQMLAAHHRKQLTIPIIGLTGSNGKTTTKELMKAVLSTKYKTLATTGNLNNHIGVPLTLLSINKTHDMAIVEMGANHVGEIALLCELARPTHGLITNIGKAHIGEFGGFENIIRAKSELFDFLLKNEGKVFINLQDPVLQNMAKRFSGALTYPEGKKCNIKYVNADPFVTLHFNDENIKTQLVGGYNFSNIAAALCVGNYFEVNSHEAGKAIMHYVPANNRSQLLKQGTNTIILDAYNANPSSMEMAINNFGKISAPSKVVILGDMLELGEQSGEEHYLLGRQVRAQQFDKSIFVGPLMKAALEAFPDAIYFEDKAVLVEYLKSNPLTNSYILIKGSRGMALEKVLDVLKGH